MKLINIKKHTANTLSIIALSLAKASSSKCLFFLAKEPKMPKSLYKKD
ncbi:hypothetical protein [Clostridium tyrobutyricum]|nr:hypothetical protein [Clostridium tyrobutyricum]MBV4438700.1 hypothetical protein [Clostridium tyrobutyricum]